MSIPDVIPILSIANLLSRGIVFGSMFLGSRYYD